MATVTAFIRVSTKKVDKANIRFRLRDGRNVDLFHKSEIIVDPDNWDNKSQTIKVRVVFKDRDKFNGTVTDRKDIVLTAYNAILNKENLTSELLDLKIDSFLHPEKYIIVDEVIQQTIFDIFNDFLKKHKLSEVRKNNYRVVYRALKRYELYTAKVTKKPFTLHLDTITAETLRDIEGFLRDEHTFKMPEIYKAVPESRKPTARGQNTINGLLTKIRTFILWANDSELTSNNPFRKFKIEECVYGTPYFISIIERNELYNKDLSSLPDIAIQRDIFIFQCLIGCRVGDLYNLTKSNISKGFIEFVARKTKDENPVTVRVPLNKTALEILNRYPDYNDERLLPFASEQVYNLAIKKAFTMAELTRKVTIINPTTGEPEQKQLNKIASSHLARRTLIGNLFKKVKDQNLISSITGHKEGSKAFARYRAIDDDMKTELINLLD